MAIKNLHRDQIHILFWRIMETMSIKWLMLMIRNMYYYLVDEDYRITQSILRSTAQRSGRTAIYTGIILQEIEIFFLNNLERKSRSEYGLPHPIKSDDSA